MTALDTQTVLLDVEEDCGHVWSTNNGAAMQVKLWSKQEEQTKVPMHYLDRAFGPPATPHEGSLNKAVAVAVVSGTDASASIRAAVADSLERKRLAGVDAREKPVELEILEDGLRLGSIMVKAQTFGTGSTLVSGRYLQASVDHPFGMMPIAVMLELFQEGQLRVTMLSPNQQTEPDSRWRGQTVMGPIVIRDRLESLSKPVDG